jgi:HlyD family secretion protein
MTTAASRPNRRINPWWGLAAAGVIVGGLIGTGTIKLPSRPDAASSSKLDTAPVTQGTFRDGISGSGTLNAVNTLDLKPKIAGTITQLPSEGQRVTKGELIARLDDSSFVRNVENAQLALSKAKAQLESARAGQVSNRANQNQAISSAKAQVNNAQLEVEGATTNLENARRLFEIGGGSAQSVTEAERSLSRVTANLESARVAYSTAQNAVGFKANADGQDLRNLQLAVEQSSIGLKNAQVDLGNSKIFAPFAGIVSSVTGQVGAPASNAAPILTLINDARVEFPVQVDESEISRVKLGQKAEVKLDALTGKVFLGKVTKISPKATVVSNIAVFYVTVALENQNRILRPGMTAEADIIAKEYPKALQIPKRALQEKDGQTSVSVLGTDGKTIEVVNVTTGPDDGSSIVITKGLQAGQNVIVPSRVKVVKSSGPLP